MRKIQQHTIKLFYYGTMPRKIRRHKRFLYSASTITMEKNDCVVEVVEEGKYAKINNLT